MYVCNQYLFFLPPLYQLFLGRVRLSFTPPGWSTCILSRIDELLAEKMARTGLEPANIRLYEFDNKETWVFGGI